MERPLPPPSALSAGGESSFPLRGGRSSSGPPPPLLLSVFLFFLAVPAAVLSLAAVKDKAALTLDYPKAKNKTAVVSVLGGGGVHWVRVLAVGVLSLSVRGEVLGVLPRRRGLLHLLVLPLPLQGGRGRLSSGVVSVVGGVLGVGGGLSLGGLPVLLQHRRLSPLFVVALPPLPPPRQVTAPIFRPLSGRSERPPSSPARVRVRGGMCNSRLFLCRA